MALNPCCFQAAWVKPESMAGVRANCHGPEDADWGLHPPTRAPAACCPPAQGMYLPASAVEMPSPSCLPAPAFLLMSLLMPLSV